MSSGLGSGIAAVSIGAILIGLASFALLTAAVSSVLYRRTATVPRSLRYLVVAIGVFVIGVSGFSVLALFDEAPALAGLFASITLVPLLVVAVYFERSTELTRLDLVTTTVMAWGLPFLLGIVVAFGVMIGVTSVVDLTRSEALDLGLTWIASTAGGITVVLCMIPLGRRLGRLLGSGTGSPRDV